MKLRNIFAFVRHFNKKTPKYIFFMPRQNVDLRHKFSRGFTLVELLVVISIISLLLSILMPSLGKAREAARQVVCLSNHKQIGLGVMLYANSEDGFYPAVYSSKAWADAGNGGKYWYFYPLKPYLKTPDVLRCPTVKKPGGQWSFYYSGGPNYYINAQSAAYTSGLVTYDYTLWGLNQDWNGNDRWDSRPKKTTQVQRSASVISTHEPGLIRNTASGPAGSFNINYSVPGRHRGWSCFSFADGHADKYNMKSLEAALLNNTGFNGHMVDWEENNITFRYRVAK